MQPIQGAQRAGISYRGRFPLQGEHSAEFPSAGLAVYWPLSEASGTRLPTLWTGAANAADLIDTNTVGSVSDHPSGSGTSALFVEANSEKLQSTAHDAALDFDGATDVFTVSGWMRPDADYGFGDLLAVQAQSWTVRLSTGTGGSTVAAKFDSFGQGNLQSPSQSTVLGTTWHHVLTRYDNATGACAVFLNGVKTTGTITTPINPRSDPVRMSQASAVTGFSAALCEVAVWDRLLTDAEVSDVYDGGAGTYYEAP
jgi:hypothetical protein